MRVSSAGECMVATVQSNTAAWVTAQKLELLKHPISSNVKYCSRSHYVLFLFPHALQYKHTAVSILGFQIFVCTVNEKSTEFIMETAQTDSESYSYQTFIL